MTTVKEATMPYDPKEYLKDQRKAITGDMVLAYLVASVFLGVFLYTNLLLPLFLLIPTAFLIEYLHALRGGYTQQIKDIEREDRRRE